MGVRMHKAAATCSGRAAARAQKARRACGRRRKRTPGRGGLLVGLVFLVAFRKQQVVRERRGGGGPHLQSVESGVGSGPWVVR